MRVSCETACDCHRAGDAHRRGSPGSDAGRRESCLFSVVGSGALSSSRHPCHATQKRVVASDVRVASDGLADFASSFASESFVTVSVAEGCFCLSCSGCPGPEAVSPSSSSSVCRQLCTGSDAVACLVPVPVTGGPLQNLVLKSMHLVQRGPKRQMPRHGGQARATETCSDWPDPSGPVPWMASLPSSAQAVKQCTDGVASHLPPYTRPSRSARESDCTRALHQCVQQSATRGWKAAPAVIRGAGLCAWPIQCQQGASNGVGHVAALLFA